MRSRFVVALGLTGMLLAYVAEAAAARQVTGTFTTADVELMQRMIVHHAQALEIVALAREKSSPLRQFAESIERSHSERLRTMQQWLVTRGQYAPEQFAHHREVELTPGMLTPSAMAELATASGGEFDRLFVERMIASHQGALTMIADLKSVPRSGQEAELYSFISNLETALRASIDRMTAMLRRQADRR
jgi:uncharacterized protein (DUF305 family)